MFVGGSGTLGRMFRENEKLSSEVIPSDAKTFITQVYSPRYDESEKKNTFPVDAIVYFRENGFLIFVHDI
jgi:hypothetical protein